MDRGQLEYSTEGSRVPFTLACVTGLGRGGGVLLRLPLSMQRDWRWEPPHPLPWSSPAILLTDEENELLDTLPRDEARCGRLSLLLPPDNALSMGTGTGTKGDAMFLSCPTTTTVGKVLHTCFASEVLCDDRDKLQP